VGAWVFGAEAQASGSNLTGSTTCTSISTIAGVATTLSANCSVKVTALGTAAGRLGYAFDRVLVYGKGGLAWTNDKYNWASTTVLLPAFAANETRWGWMLGVGLEYAFFDNWSGKIEYNYMDFGTHALHFTDPTGLLGQDTNIRERISVVKVGVNYRFGATTVAVKY
jgi:outer membrane immunogenic protein